MSRTALERHLRQHGCALRRHGGNHDIWQNGNGTRMAAVPRHREIDPGLARAICPSARRAAATHSIAAAAYFGSAAISPVDPGHLADHHEPGYANMLR